MVKVVQIYPPGYEVSCLLCVEKTLKSTVRSSPPAASNRHINYQPLQKHNPLQQQQPLQQHNPLQQQQPLQQQNPACLLPHLHIVNCLNINITEPSAVLQSVWNIKSAPIVRATYLLEKQLEERIIATYLLLLQQPIYYFSFCGNLLASQILDLSP